MLWISELTDAKLVRLAIENYIEDPYARRSTFSPAMLNELRMRNMVEPGRSVRNGKPHESWLSARLTTEVLDLFKK
jgi:hypothetical protein